MVEEFRQLLKEDKESEVQLTKEEIEQINNACSEFEASCDGIEWNLDEKEDFEDANVVGEWNIKQKISGFLQLITKVIGILLATPALIPLLITYIGAFMIKKGQEAEAIEEINNIFNIKEFKNPELKKIAIKIKKGLGISGTGVISVGLTSLIMISLLLILSVFVIISKEGIIKGLAKSIIMIPKIIKKLMTTPTYYKWIGQIGAISGLLASSGVAIGTVNTLIDPDININSAMKEMIIEFKKFYKKYKSKFENLSKKEEDPNKDIRSDYDEVAARG